jgi:hypothetical protein
MAVNDKNESRNSAMEDALNQARQNAPGFDEAKAQSAQNRANPQPRMAKGFAMLNSMFSRPLSRNGVGEHIMAYVDGFRDYLKEQLQGNEKHYSIVTVDRNTYDLPLSAIVLASRAQTNEGTVLLAYTLLLEPNDGPLESRTYQVAGQEIEIPTVPSDAYDEKTRNAVFNAVREFFNCSDEVHEVSFNVIPTDLDPKDTPRLAGIITIAVNAVAGAAKELPGMAEDRFSASMLVGTQDSPADFRVTARQDFNPAPVETSTGLPVRSDVTVAVKLVQNNAQPGDVVQPRSRTLTQVGGFFDLTYIDPQPQQVGLGQMVTPTNCYQVRYVISNIEVEINAVTPELGLLALVSTTMLSDKYAWLQGFKKRHGVQNDTRDIGAIGYEADFLTPTADGPRGMIDTNDANFNLYKLAQSAFLPDLLYSLDIQEGGDDSWVWLALQYAAHGDQDAHNAMIEVANNLTDGHFAKYWQGGPIAQHSGNLIHLGYFRNEKGQKEDIRKLDYLALLNLVGATDMQTVIAWSDTFDTNKGEPTKRLGDRTRILRGLLQDNVEFKAYAQRYDLSGEFLSCVAKGIADAGLVITPELVYGEFQQQTRGNSAVSQLALRSGVNPLFATPMSAQRGGNFGGNMFAPKVGNRF